MHTGGLGSILHVFVGRARAHGLRLRGGDVGRKTRLGPRVVVDRPRSVRMGVSVEVEPEVWLKVVASDARIEIGDYAFLGRGVEIDANRSIIIGSHVLLAPGVFITDHSHCIGSGPLIDAQGISSSPVVIEDDVWLGVRAVVLPGVRLGRGVVVGAGAVVTRSVPANAIVAGVPARVLRYRE